MYNFLENTLGIKSLILKQFIVYALVAFIPTIIDFVILYLLTELVGLYYVYSFIIAFFIGLLVSYISHKTLTFKNSSDKYASQFSVFCFFGIIAMGVNLGIVFLLVELFAIWYVIAKIIAIIIVLGLNFLVHKNITFKFF
ncbi:GtrA family protein [Patescibacteria group bacterium]|nr:GtrA family protein [Patescibacteria group bacterium]